MEMLTHLLILQILGKKHFEKHHIKFDIFVGLAVLCVDSYRQRV